MSLLIHRTEQNEIYLDRETGDILFTLPYARNGVARDFYDDGRIKAEIGYKDGKRHGVMKQIEENGACHVTNYHEGRETGIGQSFNPAGELESEMLILHDEVQWFQEYYPGTDTIRLFMPYENGKPEGNTEIFDKNGVLRETVPYVAGRKQGEGIERAPSGSTFHKTYTDNKLDNPVREFDADNRHVRDFYYELVNGYEERLSEIVTFDAAGRVATREKGGIHYHYDYEAGVARAALCDDKGPQGQEYLYDLDEYGEIVKTKIKSNPGVRYADGLRIDLSGQDDATSALTENGLESAAQDSQAMDIFRLDVRDMTQKASGRVMPQIRQSLN